MDKYKDLEIIAKNMRINIINMLKEAKSGHPGGSLSACEILAALYFKEMKIDPKNPDWVDRDRFVLSKGHAAPVLYAALAEKGYFPKEELMELRKVDSMLQGHPDMKGTPGVDMTTGSLGQGLAAANGMALAGKMDKKDYRVYTLIGDGESQEGIIWEAAMLASHYQLDNITVFLDHNGLQIDGTNLEVMNIEPIDEKFKSFGWHVIKIDGHSFEEIFKALDEAKNIKGKPSIIVAKTIKGKGVSFMEDQVDWHGKAPTEEEALKAIDELGGGIND
ncbi:putative transketolase N-terminal section [[Clostridium] ultunense Esp]|uniref:Putative transketolase N-terminal section n=1 Tax=[Clostridium] ultunense Esp TaxID=1288971 RepID=M1ZDX9_9FIRM|nr:transketolase [Schnuerera ultunensis]CCQ96821.1 putative transketolase N-terminal section [[Clostridium] ultunense Esp]SHD75585.1 putative transketolase N-terminal section [[Clostridium] ultunense Esp]